MSKRHKKLKRLRYFRQKYCEARIKILVGISSMQRDARPLFNFKK